MVREFRVNEGGEKDFELVFAFDGVWAELLQARSEGYLGTELHLVSIADRRYRVFDYWKSHRDFELFREAYQQDVEQFRKWLRSKDLAHRETLLGSFYVGELDGDGNAGLV